MPASPKKVGLLVVHGIGDQAAGETARRVLEGVQRAGGPERVREEAATGAATLQFTVADCDVSVHVYDVCWADELRTRGEQGAFQVQMVQETAWLPWLNLRAGFYPPSRGKALIAVLYGLLLIPLSGLVYLGHNGANFAWRILQALRNSLQGKSRPGRSPRQRADDAVGFRTGLDTLLDRFGGDVFTYVHSAAGAFPAKEARADAAQAILRVFRTRLGDAVQDGCDEIHVLAHSLGTVVAYHGLTGYLADAPPEPALLARIYTIGSPLDKFRFFWPRLFPHAGAGALQLAADEDDAGVHWTNFRHPLDFVSGRLDHFGSVGNRRVYEGGVLRSHAIYFRNRTFLAHFTRGLLGTELKPPLSIWTPFIVLLSFVEIAAAALLFLLPAFGGLLFYWLLSLVPRFLGWAVGHLSPVVGESIETGLLWLMVVGFTLALVTVGRRAAKARFSAWFGERIVIDTRSPTPPED